MIEQKDIIISILTAQNDSTALTAREIYNEMEPAEQGQFKDGPDSVSKTLNFMRKSGLVENGISEIVNGRTVLTWKLNKAALQQGSKPTIQILGPIELDETDLFESALANIVVAMREFKIEKGARPKLGNPSKKADILKMLTESALVNPEVKPDLTELADFIGQLDLMDTAEART